jgi:anti-sigma factor RsiW
MHTSSPSSCPSHFVLDQRALGELEHDAQRAVDAHVASCGRCQARLAARRADESRFVVDLSTLRALQTDTPVPNVAWEERAHRDSPASLAAVPTSTTNHGGALIVSLLRKTRGVVASAALAAGLVLAVTQTRSTGTQADVEAEPADFADTGVRTKGRPTSELFVQGTGGVRALVSAGAPAALDPSASSSVVHPGDILQVAVTSSSSTFVGVVSRDGRGSVSTYVGAADGTLVPVTAGRNVPLPRATVLDDVLGAETVGVFLCDHPGVLVQSLASLVQEGEPPPGCVVDRHVLQKVRTP